MKRTYIIAFLLTFFGLLFLNCTDKNILSIKDGKELSEGSQSPFYLGQNYPNPFNGQTSIRFMVLKSMHLTLSVYSEDWQKVAVAFDQYIDVGTYPYYQVTVEFEGWDLPSGDYYYVLEGADISRVRKMQILK